MRTKPHKKSPKTPADRQRDFVKWAAKQPLWDPRKSKKPASFNPADHPVNYRRVLCTFADVLGFQSMIEQSSKNESARSRIKFILDSFRRHYHSKPRDANEVHTEPAHILRNFSDLILRIIPLTDKTMKDGSVAPVDLCSEIVHEAIDLCGAQFGLLKEGILVRGGITAGDLYWDEEHVFGPALVRAYELERDLARYPRIVIDAELVRCVREDKRPNPFMELIWTAAFREDFDGMWFANYLNFYVAGSHPMYIFIREGYREPFERIREIIIQGLAETGQRTSSRRAKYMWLAKYFNDVLNQAPQGSGVDWQGLTIPL